MTSSAAPKISVCIPTYNYGKFIADAIESVLAQTFTDFELIVVDNCSIDDTKDIVASYVTVDSRVTYYANESNLGMVGNWNRCLEYARGEYVKVLCADDVLEKDCLEKSVGVFNANPTVVLVSSSRILMDMALHPTETVYKYSDRCEVVPGHKMIANVLMTWNSIGEPSAVLFRKTFAKRGFDCDYYQQADMEMWFYLLEKGDFAFLPEPLCGIRVHEQQTTHENVKSLLIIDDQMRLFVCYQHYIPWYWANKYLHKFNLAYRLWMEQYQGRNITEINGKIEKFYGINKFYMLLFLKRIKASLFSARK